jgi:aspartyl protease family protein
MMATGFIVVILRSVARDSRVLCALALAVFAGAAAAEVSLAGIFADRAMFLVDGATRTVRTGQGVAPGVRLVSVGDGGVVVDHGGRQVTLRVGQRLPGGAPGAQSVTLQANPQGHFLVYGGINGQPVRFLIDTGATMISLGASDARRLGLNSGDGQAGIAQTAAGAVAVSRVRLERVTVGEIELDGVEALIHENDLPVALLGMSFLNRTDMRREGTTMVLKRRH